MPGLVAMFSRGAGDRLAAALTPMLETLRHESFYVSGEVAVRELGVWAGWMAHPGSFASRVSSYRHHDGSAVLFSGECYNAVGGPGSCPLEDPEGFASSLIEGCRVEGASYLRRLNGLFSGLIVDRLRNDCLLFNDRFGMERLYFHEHGGVNLVASEAKAILCMAPSTRVFDPEGLAQYLKFGSVHGPRTLFKDVALLGGGTAAYIAAGVPGPSNRFFDALEWESQPVMQPDEFSSALAETLATTLPRYVAGDQAIGFSITGGLDTRMILAALPASRRNIRCYTFGGLSGETLDQQIGRHVAGLCGLEHQSLRITPHWLESFPEYVDRTVWITDGAAGATTAHEIFLTGLGRALGLVRLTGNFGSEVLRGMSTLKPWAPSQGFIAREFEPAYAAAKAPLADLHPISRAALGEVPYHLFGSLAAGRSQVAFRTPYMDNDVVSLAYRSPDAGTNSPRASLEAIDRLKPRLARIPTDRGVSLKSGRIQAAAIGALEAVRFKLDYLDKEGLPGRLRLLDPLLALLRLTPMLGKHKYLSYRTWFQRELYGYLSTAVTGTTGLGEYIDVTALGVLADEHASGRQNRLREINAVLTLSAVERLMFRNFGSEIAPD